MLSASRVRRRRRMEKVHYYRRRRHRWRTTDKATDRGTSREPPRCGDAARTNSMDAPPPFLPSVVLPQRELAAPRRIARLAIRPSPPCHRPIVSFASATISRATYPAGYCQQTAHRRQRPLLPIVRAKQDRETGKLARSLDRTANKEKGRQGSKEAGRLPIA